VLEARAVASGGEGSAAGDFLGVVGDAARLVAGGASILELLRVQRPGRAPVSGRDFANGARLVPGEPLGLGTEPE